MRIKITKEQALDIYSGLEDYADDGDRDDIFLILDEDLIISIDIYPYNKDCIYEYRKYAEYGIVRNDISQSERRFVN